LIDIVAAAAVGLAASTPPFFFSTFLSLSLCGKQSQRANGIHLEKHHQPQSAMAKEGGHRSGGHPIAVMADSDSCTDSVTHCAIPLAEEYFYFTARV
jgi:hypothetical protein